MGTFEIGAVLHWSGFRFKNGTTKDKFLVVLGAKAKHNFLLVVATSQQHHRVFDLGCHAQEGYYHIPGSGKDFFKLDTWLLLAEPYEVSPARLMQENFSGNISVAANLRQDLANAIRNCLKRVPDITPAQLALL